MGIKWGAALLHPDSAVVVDDQILNEGLSDDFAAYPLPWDEPNSQKIMIVMSDGRNTKHNRIKEAKYLENGGAEFYITADSLTGDTDNPTKNPRDVDTIIDNEKDGAGAPGDVLMRQICEEFDLDEVGEDRLNTFIYTIGFELGDDETDTTAKDVLRDCATKPTFAYEVEGEGLLDAFNAIAASIESLRLSN